MSRSSSSPAGIEPSEPATRWLEVAERVLVCARMFRDELSRQIRHRELSQPEVSMLWACRKAPSAGLSQNELANALAVSAAQVSGLVEKLRCVGLLRRRRRARPDRRRQLWKLTPAGQESLQHVLADLADWAALLDEDPGADSSGELVCLLDQLGDTLHGRRGSHAPGSLLLKTLQPVRHTADRKGAA